MLSHDDTGLTDGAFETIESALAETEQGRRFLSEVVRRARARDTQVMLEAIARLERTISGKLVSDEIDRLRTDLGEMSESIARAKQDIAELTHGHHGDGLDQVGRLDDASQALGTIVRSTEAATSDILDAAERIQETAWSMREGGFDPGLCDALDARATEIYAACVVQDLTAQRIAHAVGSLAFVEQRLLALCTSWGIPEPMRERPHLDQGRLCLTQSDIDFVIVEPEDGMPDAGLTAAAGPGPDPVPDTRPPEGYEAALARIAEIEAMDPRERLRLFS